MEGEVGGTTVIPNLRGTYCTLVCNESQSGQSDQFSYTICVGMLAECPLPTCHRVQWFSKMVLGSIFPLSVSARVYAGCSGAPVSSRSLKNVRGT